MYDEDGCVCGLFCAGKGSFLGAHRKYRYRVPVLPLSMKPLMSAIASFDVGLRTATDITNAQKRTDDARTELELYHKGVNDSGTCPIVNCARHSVAKVTLKPKFSNLKVDEASDGDELHLLPPEPKLPSIMVKPGDNLKTKLADINTAFKGDVQIKIAGKYLKIFHKDIAQHRLIIAFLRATNTEFFVITPKNQRRLKAVLKGLPVIY
ncbi:hypothetical protein CEXT_261111 [Caerostris extrusa]|uniref:Uncharacterized protein n=1 Tax=Caerostris extrusa TaxID=172846 RepID=A0AAV4U0B5_CAEEX|nr:hypothetical protein CEXT_261111 [Caerostris extrusa]